MTKTWLRAAGIRAVKTFFQAFIGTIGGSALLSDVSWPVVLSASAMAAVVSLATSLAGLPEVTE